MTWNSIMGVASTVSLILPVILILLLKLGRYRSFPALIFYFCSAFFYNLLTEGYIPASPGFVKGWAVFNNLTDIPLILFFLTYFSTSRKTTQRIHYTILTFLVFELTVVIIAGLNINAITIILGPGLVIVCGLCLYYFFRYTRQAVTNGKALGKAIMISSVMFAYGCFAFIYLMYYVFKAHLDKFGKVKPEYKADTFLIYFFVTTMGWVLLSLGIVIERKRIQKLNELRVTRKELSELYSDNPSAAGFRTAMLDFEDNAKY